MMSSASFPYDGTSLDGNDVWAEVKLRVKVPGFCFASYRFVYVNGAQRLGLIHAVFGDGQVDTKPCAPVSFMATRCVTGHVRTLPPGVLWHVHRLASCISRTRAHAVPFLAWSSACICPCAPPWATPTNLQDA